MMKKLFLRQVLPHFFSVVFLAKNSRFVFFMDNIEVTSLRFGEKMTLESKIGINNTPCLELWQVRLELAMNGDCDHHQHFQVHLAWDRDKNAVRPRKFYSGKSMIWHS